MINRAKHRSTEERKSVRRTWKRCSCRDQDTRRCRTRWSQHASPWWLSHTHQFWQTYMGERVQQKYVMTKYLAYFPKKALFKTGSFRGRTWEALTFGSRSPARSWSQTCAWGPDHRKGGRRVHPRPQKAQDPNGGGFPSEMEESCLQKGNGQQIRLTQRSAGTVGQAQTNLWLLLEGARPGLHTSQISSCSLQLGVRICPQKAKTSAT